MNVSAKVLLILLAVYLAYVGCIVKSAHSNMKVFKTYYKELELDGED